MPETDKRNAAKELGTIIQFHRQRAGLSRQQIALLAGMGKTTVFDIEHGKETVQLNTVLKLLTVLNIRITFESPLMETFYRSKNK